MDKAKQVTTSFPSHFMLSLKQIPTYEKEKEDMAMVSYSSVVRSLMYLMDTSNAKYGDLQSYANEMVKDSSVKGIVQHMGQLD
ncbi:hypothetical protein L3X38_011456 [Prunus dulcis]|uniref:Uncharacterized protein n=1 Tax=Prunus dulcis TaxID=3755 RepID=A0AAD4WHF2_PRUDU|nr:hypothetical protein L3X38_011456 [Prunus dulcis]